MKTEYSLQKSLHAEIITHVFFHATQRAAELRQREIFITSYMYGLLYCFHSQN